MHVPVGLPSDDDRRELVGYWGRRVALAQENCEMIVEGSAGATCSDVAWVFQQVVFQLHRHAGQGATQDVEASAVVRQVLVELKAYQAALTPKQ